MRNGTKEPVFGVTINDMKPIFKKIKYNQFLAEQLYTTGNYYAEAYHQDFYKKAPKEYKKDRSMSGREEFIQKYWGEEYYDIYED